MEEEGTKTGEEVQRETAQKSCRLKGWEEKGIEERCCNDAAVGTSPFPFSLFLPFSANFQSYNVGWKISIPRQWNSYLLLVISATIEECEPFSFFLLLFIRTCIALYFRLIEDRSMPISLPIGNRSSQFLRERIEGKESTCHVHREIKVAVARHRIIYALNWPSKWRHFRARDIISLPLNVSVHSSLFLDEIAKATKSFQNLGQSATFFLPGI